MSKNYLGIIIILVCSFFLLPQNTYSSSKEDYGLQVRCGKQTSEFFKKEYGDGISTHKDGQMISGYQNHYNKKLNKCFIIITSTVYPKDKKTDVLLMKGIYDFNENKEYGSFSKYQNNNSPIVCILSGKKCNSEKEWDSLVNPYMEE